MVKEFDANSISHTKQNQGAWSDEGDILVIVGGRLLGHHVTEGSHAPLSLPRLAEYVKTRTPELESELDDEGLSLDESAVNAATATLTAAENWDDVRTRQFPKVLSPDGKSMTLLWKRPEKELRITVLGSGEVRIHKVLRDNGKLANQHAEVDSKYNSVAKALQWYDAPSASM